MPTAALRPSQFAAAAFPLLLLALLLVASLRSQAADALKMGEAAPDWILTSDRGEQISFYQDSAGRPAVLIFWASWSSQCLELIPELEKLQAELAGQNLRVYALKIWEDKEAVAGADELDFAFTSLINADRVAQRYSVRSAPGVFVVDADKTIRYIRANGSTTAEVMQGVRAALPNEG